MCARTHTHLCGTTHKHKQIHYCILRLYLLNIKTEWNKIIPLGNQEHQNSSFVLHRSQGFEGCPKVECLTPRYLCIDFPFVLSFDLEQLVPNSSMH